MHAPMDRSYAAYSDTVIYSTSVAHAQPALRTSSLLPLIPLRRPNRIWALVIPVKSTTRDHPMGENAPPDLFLARTTQKSSPKKHGQQREKPGRRLERASAKPGAAVPRHRRWRAGLPPGPRIHPPKNSRDVRNHVPSRCKADRSPGPLYPASRTNACQGRLAQGHMGPFAVPHRRCNPHSPPHAQYQ